MDCVYRVLWEPKPPHPFNPNPYNLSSNAYN